MDEKTIQTYNLMAKEYDEETADFWEKLPRTFLDKFAELASGKVLNVGSGPGRDSVLLKEKGLDVVCLDASSVMVELCKEKGFTSVLGDFMSLPFNDNSFDGVWAYTSLLHVPKSSVVKAIGEISRVLKNGCVLGLGLIEGDREEYRESSGVNMLRWFSFYTKKEVEDLLKESGFELMYFEQFKPRSKNYLNFIFRKQEKF